MSSILHFSPAFRYKWSLSGPAFTPHESSKTKKRKRSIEALDDNGIEVDNRSEGLEADSPTSGYPNSDAVLTTSIAASDLRHDDDVLQPQTASRTDREEFHASNVRRPSVHHHIRETVPLMIKGQISDKLSTLKAPLYVLSGRIPAAIVENTSGSIGLRQHHLNTITAVLHRCISECDYIRASRAWAMFLRAEQHGQSMDLRTCDRWGLGAEILVQFNSQVILRPDSTAKVKEYYERIALQYPYDKALPNATGILNFSIAMFSLWVHAIKERSSIVLKDISSFNEDADETDVEANDSGQRSSAADDESDPYRKREQVRRDTLQSAHEVAAQLDGLLVSPPFSDNAMLRKLRDEMSLWIVDLSVAIAYANDGSSTYRDDEDMTVKNSYPSGGASTGTALSEENRARLE